MQQVLHGYYPVDETELWAGPECVFVLDSSVLLGLYRYPAQAREDVLSALDRVATEKALWVPHQVALEYQVGRIAEIRRGAQARKTLKDLAESTHKSLAQKLDELAPKDCPPFIDPSRLLKKVQQACDGFIKDIEELCPVQDPYQHDDLRVQIDELLDGRIGSPARSQAELDVLYEEGRQRYALKRPPGYLDTHMTGDPDATDLCGPLVLQRAYGDWLLWNQLIAEAQNRPEWKSVVLIIDDDRAHWWWKADPDGEAALGPRPELAAELAVEANVRLFWMYRTDQFLAHVYEHLDEPIPASSIAQVRDAARLARIDRVRAEYGARTRALDAQRAQQQKQALSKYDAAVYVQAELDHVQGLALAKERRDKQLETLRDRSGER